MKNRVDNDDVANFVLSPLCVYSYVSCKNDAPYSTSNMNLCSFFRLEQKIENIIHYNLIFYLCDKD